MPQALSSFLVSRCPPCLEAIHPAFEFSHFLPYTRMRSQIDMISEFLLYRSHFRAAGSLHGSNSFFQAAVPDVFFYVSYICLHSINFVSERVGGACNAFRGLFFVGGEFISLLLFFLAPVSLSLCPVTKAPYNRWRPSLFQ